MITSKQNSFVKEIKSLSDKKNRDELNLYFVEGTKLVLDALNFATVTAIVGTEKGIESLGEIKSGIRVETVSEEVFNVLTTEKTPQGVIAVIEKPKEKKVDCLECILLDGVGDPANVGAILRTAGASGFTDVFYTEDSADPFSYKCVRASMGGIFRVNVHKVNKENLLKNFDFPFIIADMNGTNVFEFEKPKKYCLVIGNEGNGVSQGIKKIAKCVVSIPMLNGTESLNAGVSAGILMYALKKPKN